MVGQQQGREEEHWLRLRLLQRPREGDEETGATQDGKDGTSQGTRQVEDSAGRSRRGEFKTQLSISK